ncbi:B12-binding domain-containing radical SAM protein [Nitrospira moscoviensis]|uniref:Radical SAM (Modular protein) n=1 Tax=Nitrospira moscoviensis TaxID=42253 RepID=A0A0K2G7C9_NITMO|nr:radical SAM protein [Nitrospira moscoviensis]ALA56840.1 Radical SAM (modular protein) [Nitrospira moscoviensis]
MKQLIQPTRVAPDHGRTVAKRRLLLVDPYPRNNPYHLTASERRAVWFPKLSLPTIAAYTPDNWDVDLVDEAVEDIDFDDPCEMVGLSIMTCYAPRAYEIAAEFRKRGKIIVMGGVHPTYCPEEALQHCDAIVCGEAEDLWPELVADYEAGRMKREYRMTSFPSLENYRSPRVELLSPDAYMTRQCSFTTRGCHFDCEFCSVSPFNGKTTRRRPVQEVVREIVQVQRWVRSELIERISNEPFWQALKTTFRIRVGIDDGGIVAFVDDLHNSNRAYCRELWAALKPLKIKWGCQSTLFLGDDEEMVKLAAESGCVSVFVGMESLDEDCLEETNKPFNRVQKFSQEIKMFHDHGIMVNPGIVFGFDNDDESVFERAVEFLTKNQVELAYFNVLTPLPGTALFDRYNAAGRIFDRDWAKYDGKHVVFHPSRMTPEQLQEGFHWANHQFYSLPNIWRRLSGTQQRLIARWEMNREFRKLVKRACPKGRLSPTAKVLKNLQAKLPTFDTENLIPSALHAIKQRLDHKPAAQNLVLNIKAKRHDKFAALFVDLEGALDRLNAQELLQRLKEASEKARMDVIINFEHLKQATPDALRTLIDSDAIKAAIPHVKVRYRKFRDAFEASLQGLSLAGIEFLHEDFQDA